MVAIDGPAGSGKSSVSKAVADRLGLSYLDTGAMYRAVTWAVLEAEMDPHDAAALTTWIQGPSAPTVTSGTNPAHPTIEVDGIDVADPIRGPAVTANVSAVSAVPAVRAWLVELQRAHVAAAAEGIVVEGRDIGSVVLPDADVKIYLTADPAVRAQRRAAEQSPHGDGADVAATESQLRERDAKDSSREVSPLTQADGALQLDTTNVTFDEVVATVCRLIDEAA